MKKILLATTVLVGTVGFASAEVALSGDARMGVTKTEGTSAQFTSRARVTFTASGETDSGLQFSATLRADNATAAAAGTAGSVSISGAFGKLTMGDVDSAFGATFGNIAGVGLTGLGDLNELAHSADGGAFGTVPAFMRSGVFTDSTYNGLFARNSTGSALTSTTAQFFGLGTNAAVLWGWTFNNAAYTASLNTQGTGTGGALQTTDLSAPVTTVSGVSTVAAAGLTVAEYNASVMAGFAGAIDTAAVNAGLLASNVVGSDFAARTAGRVYLPGQANSAADIAANVAANNAYLQFAVDVANIRPIDAKVLYEYSAGDFVVAVGHSQTGANEAYSVAGKFTTGALTVSAGIAKAEWDDAIRASITGFGTRVTGLTQNADGTAATNTFTITQTHDLEADDVNLGAKYTFDAFTVAGVYQRKTFTISNREVDQIDTTGLSVAYAMNAATTVTGFASQIDSSATGQRDIYGIGASYDLGGGATVNAGLVGGDAPTAIDAGVAFKF